MCDVELDDDRLLLLDVEAALRGLRIAATGENEAGLRHAVLELRATSRILKAPTIASSGEAGGVLALPSAASAHRR